MRRVWLHTCTLDHPNALKNYIARGMTVFMKENINIGKLEFKSMHSITKCRYFIQNTEMRAVLVFIENNHY